jgi:hypothetical protein
LAKKKEFSAQIWAKPGMHVSHIFLHTTENLGKNILLLDSLFWVGMSAGWN